MTVDLAGELDRARARPFEMEFEPSSGSEKRGVDSTREELTTRKKALIGAGLIVICLLSVLLGMLLRATVLYGSTYPPAPRPTNISMPPPGTSALFEAGRLTALRFQCRGG